MSDVKDIPVEKMDRLFNLLNYAPMPRKEKVLWVKLLPEMNEEQVDRLIGILSKQANKMTDVALELLGDKAE